MPTTTVNARGHDLDTFAVSPNYSFTFQLRGTATTNARAICTDGVYHYYIADSDTFIFCKVLKVDPRTGRECGRCDLSIGGITNLFVKGAAINKTKAGRDLYVLYDNAGTMKVGKWRLFSNASGALRADPLGDSWLTGLNAHATDIEIVGPFLHIIRGKSGNFVGYHTIYDIATAAVTDPEVLCLPITLATRWFGTYTGNMWVHHWAPSSTNFGGVNVEFDTHDPRPKTNSQLYTVERNVDTGIAIGNTQESMTWNREYVWTFESSVA
jgi:hypothetical protein